MPISEITNMQKRVLTFFVIVLIFFPLRLDRGECQDRWSRERIIATYGNKLPREWGERIRGVKTRLNTDQRVIALTLDACGGPKDLSFDAKLINYLEQRKISATLFISGRWIDTHPEIFKELAKNPLFEIENHGLNHKPCSVIGRSAFGIEGTKNAGEIFDEIEQNALKIQALTGRKPRFYRPGTAYGDEICVEIANLLGYEVVNFSVLGDAGVTYSKDQVKKSLMGAPPSSIILIHMNHPETETADGVIEAIPELKKRGFRFVQLSEWGLR